MRSTKNRRRLSLFGSVLREDFTPDSDVDVLVEFIPGKVPGFFGLVEMQEVLTQQLQRPVDLRTSCSLSEVPHNSKNRYI